MSTKRERKRLGGRHAAPRTDEGDVGYCRPPRVHQFKPGQSGNPRGRPRGAKNEATILGVLLNRKVNVYEGGRARKITVLEAILLQFAKDALNGNAKSATFLLNRHAQTKASESQSSDEISGDDRKVLDDFARRIESQLNQRRKRS